MKFKEYNAPLSLSEINKEILRHWDETDLFHQSMELRDGAPSFVFYEGPPSANGMPGIHHVMARTIKDIFCRFKTMKGFSVARKAGWDTHGLPVELGVEKTLGITKEDIGKKISVDDYNAACRSEVMKYTAEWTDLTHRMGYWVDLENPYITYDSRYMETLWWLLERLYKKGYLYKGYTIQPYSPAAGTGLSSHELNQPGCYRDVKDTTCTALFRLRELPEALKGCGEAYLAAWTTTPWTLPSNTALCIGPKIEYVALQTFNPYTGAPIVVVVAKERVYAYFKPDAEVACADELTFEKGVKNLPWRKVAELKASDLIGLHYHQLMPWVKPIEKLNPLTPEYARQVAETIPERVFEAGSERFVQLEHEAFRVISGDYVTTEDGTGIVHIAPTFGADDARVAKAAGIPPLFLVDRRGQTRPMVDLKGRYFPLDELDPAFVDKCVNRDLYDPWAGRYVKNDYDPSLPDPKAADTLDVDLCIMLKAEGKALRIEKHEHNYPHCWRTDKPVLYYPLDSWFIRSTAARDRLIELNKTILWKPTSTGSGRFGKWLENLQDWNLSRSRYWGTPLPIWRTEDGAEEICIGSYEQLYHEIERSVEAGVMQENPLKKNGFVPGVMTAENYSHIDIHRPRVDEIMLVSPTGRPMKRETDLIDVWFDSGAMPYAQLHYPFENADAVDARTLFPADFIAEGVDQTRGWFFTLHALGVMGFDSVAYKAVVSNGLVLDKHGVKMSKRLGNAIDPFAQIETYGSDAVRWYMIENSQPWDNLKYDPDGVAEVSRKLFATLHNTYKFFALYADIDGFTSLETQVPLQERSQLDRWILSLLATLTRDVDQALEQYEPTRAARAISTFVIDNLSNWYVRLSRSRFWAGKMTADKLSAYQTLYKCLLTLSRLMAPIAPFYADRLHSDLLAPVTGREYNPVHLEDFPQADTAAIDHDLEAAMALAQDITSAVLALRRKVAIKVRQPLQALLVPVNGDKMRTLLESIAPIVMQETNIKEIRTPLAAEAAISRFARPDFKKLGPRYGKVMKALGAAIRAMDSDTIARLEAEGSYAFPDLDGAPVINLDDVEISAQDIPGWAVGQAGNLTIALDVTLTDALKDEGMVREIVNRVQNLRKDKDYSVTDRIILTLAPSPELERALAAWSDYLAQQVQADKVMVAPVDKPTDTLDIDGIQLPIILKKS